MRRSQDAGTFDLLSIGDLSPRQVERLVLLAGDLKAGPHNRPDALRARRVLLLFERPSLRTRLSIEVAVQQLGGKSTAFSMTDIPGVDASRLWREIDVGVHLVALRVEHHETLKDFAARLSVPILNARSDQEHPCQVLADLLTIREVAGRVAGARVAFVGEARNILNSLVLGAALTGLILRVSSPTAALPSAAPLVAAQRAGADVRVCESPREAVEGADVVYAGMPSAASTASDAQLMWKRYQVNEDLLLAAPNAVVMHAMPAVRGREITADVLDGPRSVALRQAENRLHMQKAILLMMLGAEGSGGP